MSDYDFAGYVTRNDVKCSDGRIIRQDAFKGCDGLRVPLVYQHDHMSPLNILGHCDLENRSDGVYGYAKCNMTDEGQHALASVQNGDVDSFSIYANKLKQDGPNVIHGAIREVSLVLCGANPEAKIETILSHDYDEEEEAILEGFSNFDLSHADKDEDEKKVEERDEEDASENGEGSEKSSNESEQKSDESEDEKKKKKDESGMANNLQHADGEKTVQDVIDTMNEEQKNVLYALVGMAADGGEGSPEGEDMKHNVFADDTKDNTMQHSEIFSEVLRDAKRFGSLKESALQHDAMNVADEMLAHANYGIESIDTLFPDYKSLNTPPEFVSRNMDWVNVVMNGVSHTPFSRIKSMFANITADEARAKGYIKGKQKKEEVFPLLKRTTDPQTIYKKQKLDRDDVIDITDFDVVVWLKAEMRLMLDEEIARAILIGDGRSVGEEDHISEDHIRPVWKDDPFYTIRTQIELDSSTTEDDKYKALIRAAIKARKNYKGSGNPTLFTTEDNLTGMLLLTDTTGRDLYESTEQLAKKLRVSNIVTVEVMEEQTRTADTKDTQANSALTGKKLTLEGLIVNLKDYNVGADKGGAVSMFDDFDIDYNQMKYLIETRCSGALVKPYAAIALETYPKA